MPRWGISIIVVMVIAIAIAIASYRADDGRGYLGKFFGVICAFLSLAAGVIISIVIVVTKLWL